MVFLGVPTKRYLPHGENVQQPVYGYLNFIQFIGISGFELIANLTIANISPENESNM